MNMAWFFSEGVYRVGGGVSVPRLISLRQPEYSAEALAARILALEYTRATLSL